MLAVVEEIHLKRKLSDDQCSGSIFSDYTIDEAAYAAATERQLSAIKEQRQSGGQRQSGFQRDVSGGFRLSSFQRRQSADQRKSGDLRQSRQVCHLSQDIFTYLSDLKSRTAIRRRHRRRHRPRHHFLLLMTEYNSSEGKFAMSFNVCPI